MYKWKALVQSTMQHCSALLCISTMPRNRQRLTNSLSALYMKIIFIWFLLDSFPNPFCPLVEETLGEPLKSLEQKVHLVCKLFLFVLLQVTSKTASLLNFPNDLLILFSTISYTLNCLLAKSLSAECFVLLQRILLIQLCPMKFST